MTNSTYFCLTVFYDCLTAKNWLQIFTPQGQKRHNTLKSCYLLNTPPAYYEGSDKRRTLEYPQTFR